MGLLYNFRPLIINPELAIRIGLNEAIVLQQIKYWLTETESGHKQDGREWVYNTYEEWQKQFPFWSVDTIKRTFRSLEKQGCVFGEKLQKAQCNHTKFYAINYGSSCLIEEGKMPQSKGADSTVLEEGKMPQSKGADSTVLTEITNIYYTDTTTDIQDLREPALPVSPKEKIGDETSLQTACKNAWRAYCEAYYSRYGVAPVRNQKINAQVKQFVQRVGMDCAPDIARFYLTLNDAFLVRKLHPVGSLLADAESLYTQWATGNTMTATRARQIDQTQANYSAADEGIAMLRAKREREAQDANRK